MNDPDGGILIIDKQAGMTSAGVVSRIRRLLKMKRVGHTGTLDPFATGVLPICFGRATRASAYMLHWDKRYRVDIRLGYATTTMDIEGEAILPIADVGECRKWLEDEPRIRQEVERLVEEKEQRPPMYSAIKHRGKPLYEYARQGIEIERPMRSIRVYESVFKNLWEDEQGYPIVSVELMVSAGTYIRSLADLLGQRLGCGAHAAALRRLSVGHFDLQKALTLDELESKIDTLDAHDWV
ncbi:MAG: tRNA pseudouridine(55) synthase TruB, partial [Eubacteriales bacterium]|nr:tRNA pseudouridine(55) synthase TruB [Eubacteriales bacterium]